MEFRILGPIDVVVGPHRLEVNGIRQQIVLATLLLSANRVVTMERLLEAVYGDQLPRTSRSQVQISISALRRLLAEHGRSAEIVTQLGSYMLRVSERYVDALRFEELIANARITTEPEEALARYRDALRLWRGPALFGLDRPPIRLAAERLDELRLTTIENRMALELDLGRHREVVAELAELAAEHPLRERVQAHLMRALHSCGRTAEALRLYQRVRGTFVTGLGLEPSAELQGMHEAILRADPALETVAPASLAAPAMPRTPNLLPRDIADFIGRREQIGELRRRLVEDRANPAAVPVVVLSGPAGVGKTVLAVHAAHVLDAYFPDGQLYVNLHGEEPARSVSPAEVLGRFLRALGVPASSIPEALDERAEIYRDLLSGRKVLITLDNAADESQVGPLIPGSGAAAVVVTGRDPLVSLPAAAHVEVGVFEADQSIELLDRIADVTRVDGTAKAAVLAKHCGNLPRALRTVGARLLAHPDWSVRRLVEPVVGESERFGGCHGRGPTLFEG